MNWQKFSSWVQKTAKAHKVLAALVLLQGAVLLVLAAGLLRPAYSLTLTPQDFAGGPQQPAAPQYQAQVTEQSVQFQIAEDARRLPESEGTAEFEPLVSQGRPLRSGAYTVTVYYQADSTSANIRAAQVSFQELRFDNLVYGDLVTLTGAWSTLTGRLWVPLGADAQQVAAQITPLGECDFQIESIVLQEQPVYRVVRLLGLALLFAFADGIGAALFAAGTVDLRGFVRRHGAVLALGLVCVWACFPLWEQGLFWSVGEDHKFHWIRIVSLAQGLADGQFPVRLYTDMLNGYGYATPLYYCDLFLYLPALLYNCMVPLQLCYKIYVALATAATAGFCYGALRRMTVARGTAVAGTALYLLANYRLVNIYFRGAVGEYTAMVWLPLVILGMYGIYTTEKPAWRAWLPLAAGVAGLVQCHVLSLEMTLIFLVLFALLCAPKTFRKARLLAIFKAAGVSVGLSAWFAVPMLDSMLTQRVQVNENIGLWNFQAQASSLGEMLALFPNMETTSSRGSLGAALALGALLAVVVLLGRGAWQHKEKTLQGVLHYSVLLGGVAVVLAWDKFPWDALLSHLYQTQAHRLATAVQFPWRYLTIASVCLAVATAAALELLRRYKRALYAPALSVLLSAAVVVSGMMYHTVYQLRDLDPCYTLSENDRNVVGVGEYLLSREVDLNYPRPQPQDEALLVKWYDKTQGAAHITLENTGDSEASVALPIFHYNHYRAVDAQGAPWPLTTDENGLIVLTVPGGYSGSFTVTYQEPPLWRAAELVSLATLGGLLVFWLREKRKKRPLQQLPGNAQR